MTSCQALPATAARHASVGVFCATINIAIVHVCTANLGWHYMAAVGMTILVTVPVSYLLHRRISFRLRHAVRLAEVGRFVIQQGLQLAGGTALLGIGVEVLGLTPTVAMAVAVLLMWLFALATHMLWVFAPPPRRS